MPHGNHRNEKNVHSNQSDCENPESPASESEVPTLATSSEDRNLEITPRPNFSKTAMPIYENLPYGFKVSRNMDQSDLFLQGEVLRLRNIIGTIGDRFEETKVRIFELKLMVEKLVRDNKLLKTDSRQKQQTIHSQALSILQLTNQKSQLFFQLQGARIANLPPKYPAKYSPSEASQPYYAPIRTRSDAPQVERYPNTIPRKLSQSELGEQKQLQQRLPVYPVASKRRPKDIPIETKKKPLNTTYPVLTLSPNKDTRTHLLNMSVSAKTRNQRIGQSDLLPSPISEATPVANQNAAFGLKPSHPADSRMPHGSEDRNLEITPRPNFSKTAMPIYENLPYGFNVSQNMDQLDLLHNSYSRDSRIIRIDDWVNQTIKPRSQEYKYCIEPTWQRSVSGFA